MQRFFLPKPLISLLLVLLFVANGCLLQPTTPAAMNQAAAPASTGGEAAADAAPAAESNYAMTTESVAAASGALAVEGAVVNATPSTSNAIVDTLRIAPEATSISLQPAPAHNWSLASQMALSTGVTTAGS